MLSPSAIKETTTIQCIQFRNRRTSKTVSYRSDFYLIAPLDNTLLCIALA